MKKINVITYCAWGSIGSILQSYALTKTLNDLGHENTLWLEEWNRIVFHKKPASLKDCIRWIYKRFYRGKIDSAYRKRMDFISKHMKAKYFSDWDMFHKKALDHKKDIYLAGSDQIWNFELCRPLFFLNFVENSKKISYAANMGETRTVPENEDKIKEYISSFDKISVREQVCFDILTKMTDKEISVNIDPTFLVNVEDWRSIEQKYNVHSPYILLYMLYWNDAYKVKISELKKRTGLPVYAICSDVSHVYADKRFFDVGVGEFLWLIDNAKYVITSSFHGVALSIIFRKQFTPVINPSSPSRIEHILKLLNVPCVDIDELDRTEDFNYDDIYTNIERERQRSIAYLKDAIE